MVADSACSATAYLCGVKGNDDTIGVTAAVQNKDCVAQQNTSNHVHSILRKAQVGNLFKCLKLFNVFSFWNI